MPRVGVVGTDNNDLMFGIPAFSVPQVATGSVLPSSKSRRMSARYSSCPKVGGFGADILTGGAGPDLFEFLSIAESTVANAGRDRIMDFNAAEGDQIDLRILNTRLVDSGKPAFTFIGSDPFSHTAGELNFVGSGAAAFLKGDVNGDGVADFSVRLENVPTLTGADILL